MIRGQEDSHTTTRRTSESSGVAAVVTLARLGPLDCKRRSQVSTRQNLPGSHPTSCTIAPVPKRTTSGLLRSRETGGIGDPSDRRKNDQRAEIHASCPVSSDRSMAPRSARLTQAVQAEDAVGRIRRRSRWSCSSHSPPPTWTRGTIDKCEYQTRTEEIVIEENKNQKWGKLFEPRPDVQIISPFLGARRKTIKGKRRNGKTTPATSVNDKCCRGSTRQTPPNTPTGKRANDQQQQVSWIKDSEA